TSAIARAVTPSSASSPSPASRSRTSPPAPPSRSSSTRAGAPSHEGRWGAPRSGGSPPRPPADLVVRRAHAARALPADRPTPVRVPGRLVRAAAVPRHGLDVSAVATACRLGRHERALLVDRLARRVLRDDRGQREARGTPRLPHGRARGRAPHHHLVLLGNVGRRDLPCQSRPPVDHVVQLY